MLRAVVLLGSAAVATGAVYAAFMKSVSCTGIAGGAAMEERKGSELLVQDVLSAIDSGALEWRPLLPPLESTLVSRLFSLVHAVKEDDSVSDAVASDLMDFAQAAVARQQLRQMLCLLLDAKLREDVVFGTQVRLHRLENQHRTTLLPLSDAYQASQKLFNTSSPGQQMKLLQTAVDRSSRKRGSLQKQMQSLLNTRQQMTLSPTGAHTVLGDEKDQHDPVTQEKALGKMLKKSSDATIQKLERLIVECAKEEEQMRAELDELKACSGYRELLSAETALVNIEDRLGLTSLRTTVKRLKWEQGQTNQAVGKAFEDRCFALLGYEPPWSAQPRVQVVTSFGPHSDVHLTAFAYDPELQKLALQYPDAELVLLSNFQVKGWSGEIDALAAVAQGSTAGWKVLFVLAIFEMKSNVNDLGHGLQTKVSMMTFLCGRTSPESDHHTRSKTFSDGIFTSAKVRVAAPHCSVKLSDLTAAIACTRGPEANSVPTASTVRVNLVPALDARTYHFQPLCFRLFASLSTPQPALQYVLNSYASDRRGELKTPYTTEKRTDSDTVDEALRRYVFFTRGQVLHGVASGAYGILCQWLAEKYQLADTPDQFDDEIHLLLARLYASVLRLKEPCALQTIDWYISRGCATSIRVLTS